MNALTRQRTVVGKDAGGCSLARRLIATMNEGIRYDRIKAEMDRMIAGAPGDNRGEKLAWCWKQPAFQKLYRALELMLHHEAPPASRYDRLADKYYVRFADRPPEPGFKSAAWDGGTRKAYDENGISAYSAKWSTKYNAWEIDRVGDSYGPEDLIGRTISDPNYKAYLLVGPGTGDEGSDGEPLIDGAEVEVVKTLSPLEMVVPGYFDPTTDLDDSDLQKIANMA